MLLFLSFFWLLPVAFAAFGWSDNGKEYVIDSGSKLVIKVSKTNGDITSLNYGGTEYQGWGGKNTHVEIGLGQSTVSIQQFTTPANIIKVSVTYGTLKHWIFVRYGNNNVYLFTNKKDNDYRVQRYIVRLKAGTFTNTDDIPDFYDGGAPMIEASDVAKNSKGYTKSKHYQGSNYGRIMDHDYVGRSNGKVGIYMIRSNHEKASGGPFFRSLERRIATDSEDLYDIYWYSMGHTDPERFGLQGPSVISFTDGGEPNANLFARKADYSWFDTLGIDGWVPASGRGYASGVGIKNMKSGFPYVVGLSNTAAQYWTTATAGTGAWTIKSVLPGTYTLTIYKGELGVYTGSVTIKAGAGAAVNSITPTDPTDTTAIWRIGTWDGTPAGFLNFEDTPMKPTYMHPSDGRLKNWKPSNFIVGTSATNAFPGYMWKDINGGFKVYFKLSADQITTSHKLRFGITEAYINGRPQITVNSWTSAIPAASSQGGTRSLTVGTYRGNNHVFEYTIPATAWLAASEYQVLTINIVSGSSGSGYLSAGISVDAIDLL